MDTPSLHRMFMDRMKSCNSDAPVSKIKNGVVLTNPTNHLDCTPDADFENFRHLMNGDALVYCELANSTPFTGHYVDKRHIPLVHMRARTCCVFSDTDIRKMRRQIVGVCIFRSHPYSFMFHDKDKTIGEVVDASVMKCEFDGSRYLALCALCWIDRKNVDDVVKNGDILYLSFGISVSQETCCRCGRTSNEGVPCRHIKNGSPNSALSICAFSKFNTVALED